MRGIARPTNLSGGRSGFCIGFNTRGLRLTAKVAQLNKKRRARAISPGQLLGRVECHVDPVTVHLEGRGWLALAFMFDSYAKGSNLFVSANRSLRVTCPPASRWLRIDPVPPRLSSSADHRNTGQPPPHAEKNLGESLFADGGRRRSLRDGSSREISIDGQPAVLPVKTAPLSIPLSPATGRRGQSCCPPGLCGTLE